MDLYCMIYELKGLVDSLDAISNYDNEIDNTVMIENVKAKTDEIVEHIKNHVATEPYNEIKSVKTED